VARIAVVGAGWAGLSCAVRLTALGGQVTLFEAAPQAGGRARSVQWTSLGDNLSIDNGQHILIGAYRHCLDAMREVGLNPAHQLMRLPFGLPTPQGWILRANQTPWLSGPLQIALGTLTSQLSWPARSGLVRLGWKLLSAPPAANVSVADWLPTLDTGVRRELIEPLCVAALNTPIAQTSAQHFCQVLKSALFGPAGAADYLVPRVGLSALYADAALTHLRQAGCDVRLATPIRTLVAGPDQVDLNGEAFEACVVATSPHVLPGLLGPALCPEGLNALAFEPIATVYLRLAAPPQGLPAPMMALPQSDPDPLGHWLFDRWALDAAPVSARGAPLLAIVTSAARAALSCSRDEWLDRVQAQVSRAVPNLPAVVDRMLIVDKRATFSCVAGLPVLGHHTASPRVCIAGDFTQPLLPATLEAAIQSGQNAALLVAKGAN
jgi:squalene-associated FAD-dependent desaturase